MAHFYTWSATMYRALCEVAARTSESPGRLRRCAPYKGLPPLAPLRGYPPINLTVYRKINGLNFCQNGKETITTKKSREELEKEYAEATAKLEQYQHRGQRYENRIRYYTEGERKKRNHRLIVRGAEVESVVPEVRGMSQSAFRTLVEQIFSLPEVAALVRRSIDQQEGN